VPACGSRPDADHPHVEGLGELGEAAADLAETDDQQHLVGELAVSCGHLRPCSGSIHNPMRGWRDPVASARQGDILERLDGGCR